MKTRTKILSVLAICVFFSCVAAKSDWKSDANARIELNRKRNAEITVLDSGGNPISDVNVQIEQVKHRFGFGAALAYGLLNSNPTYRTFVLDHFEWAVCENEMKWQSIENTRDDEQYGQADYIANWCANNDIKLRGHCIMWEQSNSQMPSWLKTLGCSEMVPEINERVDSIVGRYAGQIVSWDVDNEMLPTGSDYNFFGTCLGDSGRANVFNRAKSIDPGCGMYMNEFTGNSFGGYDGNEYVARANSLINTYGAQIDGLGIQAHVASPFQPETYYNNVLNELDDLGLPIIATEFDTDAGTATQVANDLENFYRICFSHPNVEAIIMWGFEQSAWRWDGIVNSSTWVLNEAGVRYESLMNEWTTNDVNITNLAGDVNFRGFHGTYEITLIKAGETNEIYEIELEPGSTTQQFILDTNFTGGPPDTNAPTPDPMTWATTPIATGPYTITMTATTATDPQGVQYFFDCITTGGHDSGWQDSPTYIDSGLNPSTQYTYQVKARDKSPNYNETGWSSTQFAITYPPDTTPPMPNPMTWATVPTATGAYSITMTATTATDATSPPVQYYFECTTDGSKSSGWQTSATYVASGLTPNTNYSFRVEASDSAPASNITGWSSTLSSKTPMPPVNILGSWVSGTSHTKENGGNRILVLIAHAEEAGAINLSSITYGGQPMTKVIDIIVGTSYQAYVVAYILDEAGVAAATSGTFVPTWSTTPDDVSYSSVFLENVDQTTLIGASASNTSTTTGITTVPLATEDGDMVIDAATCGNVSNYTINNGFTKAIELDMASSTGVTGYKSASGATETPSVTNSNTNRQVLIGFVVNAYDAPVYSDCGEVIAAGHRLPSDLSGDCYVNYLDVNIMADYWLNDDCNEANNYCGLSDFEPRDGAVDFFDFSDFAMQWLVCNDPEGIGCMPNW